ncbi:MAG: hypothetical protein K8S62_00775 [Candidatus Sabulitectum sp.]|nr:hypothetical protein [Candidatus Sabulitectum sp.]
MAQFVRKMSNEEIATFDTEDVVAVLAVHQSATANMEYILYVISTLMPSVGIDKCTFEVLDGNPRDSSSVIAWIEEKRLLKTLFYATTVFANAGVGVVGVTIVCTKIPGRKTVIEIT